MRLSNGIETIELGATSWRVMINANFEKMLTKTEINELLNARDNEIQSLKAQIEELKAQINALQRP